MDFSLKRAVSLATANGKRSLIMRINDSFAKIIYYTGDIPAFFNITASAFQSVTDENAFDYIAEYDMRFLYSKITVCKENEEPFTFNISIKNRNKGGYTSTLGTATYLGYEDGDIFLVSLSLAGPKSEVNTFDKDMYNSALSLGGIQIWDFDLKTERIIDADNVFPFWKNYNDEKYPEILISNGIVRDDDINILRSSIARLYNGENEVAFDIWYHFANGKAPRFIRIKYMLDDKNDSGHRIAHGMSIDLTEKKMTELAFENRSKSLLKNNPDTIVTLQINLTTNKIALLLSNAAEFISMSSEKKVDDILSKIADYISANNEKKRFLELFGRKNMIMASNVGNLQVKYEHYLRVDNREVWVNTTADIVVNPITLEAEAFIHIVNINKLKVLNALINGTVHREYDFIALVNVNTDGFFIIDKYGHDSIVEVPNFKEYFSNELIKAIAIPSERQRVIAEMDYEHLCEEIDANGVYILRYNTNEVYEKNRHHIIRMYFLDNRKDIIAITSREVTKIYNDAINSNQKLSEALEEAKRANSAKSEFLSLVSHDIRTPLNGIIGMTQLAMKATTDASVNEYLKKANMSEHFLLGLINDLLDMTKIEAGKLDIISEKYPISELSDYLEAVIVPLCNMKNQEINIILPDSPSNIIIDKRRFNQILFNLLSNASKYSNVNGKIELVIHIEPVDDTMCILSFSVKDNGIGMSASFQEKLFEAFSQENRMHYLSNEGTGLGLTITHKLIELMGGEITVFSEIDKGSTFTVQLTCPYTNDTDENTVIISKDNPVDEKLLCSGLNVLICEDNAINQEIAKAMLESFGANVDVAEDGECGVSLIKNSSEGYYSIVFMDIRMPNMDGLTASKTIRKIGRKDTDVIPIIAMTANAMDEDRMECTEAGMNAFIPKPIDINLLRETIKRILNK